MAKTSQLYEIVYSRVFILLISYLMITTTFKLLCMLINFYFQFQFVQCESAVFTTLNLLAKYLTKVILLARFFLQRIMFIKFISALPER